MYIFRYPLSNQ